MTSVNQNIFIYLRNRHKMVQISRGKYSMLENQDKRKVMVYISRGKYSMLEHQDKRKVIFGYV